MWSFRKLRTLVLSEVGSHPLMLSLFAELFLLCSLQLAESELFDKGRQHGKVSAAPYLVGLPYMGIGFVLQQLMATQRESELLDKVRRHTTPLHI